MQCKKCGAEVAEGIDLCPTCGDERKQKPKRPIAPVRLMMQLISLALCLILMVGLLGTVLLADVHLLTSSGGIQTIISQMTARDDSAQPATDPAASVADAVLLGETTQPQQGHILPLSSQTDATEPTEGIELPGGVQIPADLLTGSGPLTEFTHDIIREVLGTDIPITSDQVMLFLLDSTVLDFVAEKAAVLVDDILSGQLNDKPIITAEEIVALVEENQDSIERHFHVEITEEMTAQMSQRIHQNIDEEALNQSLRHGVDQVLAAPVPGLEDMSVSDLMAKVNQFARVEVICILAGVCVVLMILMMVFNSYDLPRGLSWNAAACLLAGAALSLPLLMLHLAPALLQNILPEAAQTLSLVGGASLVIAPLHYGLLALGTVMLITSAIWQIRAKKQ